jgi:DNA mismatch repair protein MutS
VAICEQVEDPKQAKGVVKREVVRVVTPGLVVDPDNLEAKENNYLAALVDEGGRFGLAFVDISTGEFRVTDLDPRNILSEMAGLPIREILLPETLNDPVLERLWDRRGAVCRVNRFPPGYFDVREAAERLAGHFPAEVLAAMDMEHRPAALCAAGAVLRYMEENRLDCRGHLNRLEAYGTEERLLLDDTAKETLEIFATIQEGKRQGSLLHVLDETVTAMGGRRLRSWLHSPLVDPVRIRARLAAVSELLENHLLRGNLRRLLASVYDLERLGGRIAMEAAHARDLSSLKASLELLPGIRRLVEPLETPFISAIAAGMDEMADVRERIERSLVDEPPLTIREGGLIREGYDPELDEVIARSRNGKAGIAALEAAERERTGIASLKVGFNNVFGYYIEVSHANAHLVPGDYVRKQTLVNAERYINSALKEFEHAVMNAEEKRRQMEYDLFGSQRRQIMKEVQRIQKTAALVADLDVLSALAEVAERYRYCRPTVDDSDRIDVVDGRHPMVERFMSGDRFVPNDLRLDRGENRFLVITGPNMAGKSTFIRQAALIVLMAQIGSFVPAASAHIGVADRIFTRIGASDSLSRGQSTFMVEMNEVANILRNATGRSIIVLDEVGRGTSTFDGLSIAWAVAEYIQDSETLGARTLFATHYHQLLELAATRKGVKNYNIAVREWGDRIIFLRKIMAGGASRSYGIQVAQIAGLPDSVIGRAKEILKNLESGELDRSGRPRLSRQRKGVREPALFQPQLNLFMTDEEAILEELRDLDIMSLSPSRP